MLARDRRAVPDAEVARRWRSHAQDFARKVVTLLRMPGADPAARRAMGDVADAVRALAATYGFEFDPTGGETVPRAPGTARAHLSTHELMCEIEAMLTRVAPDHVKASVLRRSIGVDLIDEGRWDEASPADAARRHRSRRQKRADLVRQKGGLK